MEEVRGTWSSNGARAQVFSGHESFACRYGWLIKLYHALDDNPELFASDDEAILTLGLGKNMVKSIRFWGSAFGLARQEKRQTLNTSFAKMLLDPIDGLDPYLEDAGSLWRLHWHIAVHGGLGAWVIALQDVLDARITRDRLISLAENRAAASRGAISRNTASAHVDIFLRTYDWSRSDASSAAEEGANSPFQELRLLETAYHNGSTIISFNRGPKPDLRLSDLAFALRDFWVGTASESTRLSMRALQLDKRSPAAIFRLDENSLHIMVEELARETGLVIESDGAGGAALLSPSGGHLERLEALAWPNK
jgi:hypothetical protein